jgi:hypothetical protein
VFADRLGIKYQNNVSARLENPNYGKHSLTTLKKIAATCDVALVVWFVPFSRLLDWVTGTPYTDNGLSEGFYDIPSFADDFREANLGSIPLETFRGSQQTNNTQIPAGEITAKKLPPASDLGAESLAQANVG